MRAWINSAVQSLIYISENRFVITRAKPVTASTGKVVRGLLMLSCDQR